MNTSCTFIYWLESIEIQITLKNFHFLDVFLGILNTFFNANYIIFTILKNGYITYFPVQEQQVIVLKR